MHLGANTTTDKVRGGEARDPALLASLIEPLRVSPLTGDDPGGRKAAATEIGALINRIVALAPVAGLYVGIKIEPAKGS